VDRAVCQRSRRRKSKSCFTQGPAGVLEAPAEDRRLCPYSSLGFNQVPFAYRLIILSLSISSCCLPRGCPVLRGWCDAVCAVCRTRKRMTQWTLAATAVIGHPRNHKSWPRARVPMTGARRLSAFWAQRCFGHVQVKPSRPQGLHCPG
jgi:hypothetical protein